MNKDSMHRFLWVCIFGVTMGFFEASVVVYLRKIFYPEGFRFPLASWENIDPLILAVEVGREFMSILMLAAVGVLAGRRNLERFFFFLCGFGVWDIFYYIFLYVILGWPASLVTWDILFFIPLPWVGPVWAPVAISLFFIAGTLIFIYQEDKKQPVRFSAVDWIAFASAAFVIIISFIYDGSKVMRGAMPQPYLWWLFALGTAIWISVFLRAWRKSTRKS